MDVDLRVVAVKLTNRFRGVGGREGGIGGRGSTSVLLKYAGRAERGIPENGERDEAGGERQRTRRRPGNCS